MSIRPSPPFGTPLAYSIQITRPARQDAQEYAAFIHTERQSPGAARHWLPGLYEAITGLREAPHRFAVIAEAGEAGFPYRAFVYHSHRVVYAVDDTAQVVLVLRIYHTARQSLSEQELRDSSERE